MPIEFKLTIKATLFALRLNELLGIAMPYILSFIFRLSHLEAKPTTAEMAKA